MSAGANWTPLVGAIEAPPDPVAIVDYACRPLRSTGVSKSRQGAGFDRPIRREDGLIEARRSRWARRPRVPLFFSPCETVVSHTRSCHSVVSLRDSLVVLSMPCFERIRTTFVAFRSHRLAYLPSVHRSPSEDVVAGQRPRMPPSPRPRLSENDRQ